MKRSIRKIAAVIMVMVLTAGALASCERTPPYEERPVIRIATLKGPTGIGAVKLFADNEAKLTANRYETLIVGAPDEIVGKITTGQLDIAAVPTNLAATLYNKTEGEVQLLALNTLGVLYILEKGDTVSSVEDLRGKKLYATGKGSTPEFILDHILTENGIDPENDIDIEYKTEHSELLTLAASGNADLVLLPEPFVTTLLSRNVGFVSKIDLTSEWDALASQDGQQAGVLAMGGIIVRKEFAENNKAAVDAFLKEYEDSVKYTESSPDETAALVVKYGIMADEGLAKQALPGCNIVFIGGDEMKGKIGELYEVFVAADPKSIGGKLPGEDFYYGG